MKLQKMREMMAAVVAIMGATFLPVAHASDWDAAIASMPLGASEAMSYNELDITVNSYWDTTGRTGVAVETDSCEFPDDLEISAFDIQWSGEFDLSTTKCGLMLIVR